MEVEEEEEEGGRFLAEGGNGIGGYEEDDEEEAVVEEVDLSVSNKEKGEEWIKRDVIKGESRFNVICLEIANNGEIRSNWVWKVCQLYFDERKECCPIPRML